MHGGRTWVRAVHEGLIGGVRCSLFPAVPGCFFDPCSLFPAVPGCFFAPCSLFPAVFWQIYPGSLLIRVYRIAGNNNNTFWHGYGYTNILASLMLVKWLCIEELVCWASCLKSWTGRWVWGVTSSSLFCVTNQLSRNINSEGKSWGKGRVQGGTAFILGVWWEHCDEERWDENRTILFSGIDWWWYGWWWQIDGKTGVGTVIVFTARSTDVEKMTDRLV